MITEDGLANALIVYSRNDECSDTDIHLEVSYNHYGESGVVDLVMENYDIHIIELKSDAAIKEATGANEIIRQFNRHRKYFFEGSTHSPRDNTTFELCFAPTPTCLKHIIDNWSLYATVLTNEPTDMQIKRLLSIITIRPPDPNNITPLHPFVEAEVNGDMHSPPSQESFLESTQQVLPERDFKRLRPVIIEKLG